ncbi:hypothetical protein PM082_022617 [Marasmius tenuissimus]|nr:hypothetical protein PM082_022617 [Marasmius tenuissimus]
MLQYNKFLAWIAVDDEPLQEYEVQVEEATNTVTCWVASEAGKPYKVHWSDDEYRSATVGWVRADGHECGGKVVQMREIKSKRSRCKEGLHVTETSFKPFAFADMRTSSV